MGYYYIGANSDRDTETNQAKGAGSSRREGGSGARGGAKEQGVHTGIFKGMAARQGGGLKSNGTKTYAKKLIHCLN